MAVIFADGFDGYSAASGSATALSAKWTINGGAPSIQTGRFGGKAIRFRSGQVDSITSPLFSTPPSSFTVSMSFKSGTLDNDKAFAFYSGGTEQLAFRFSAAGELGVYGAAVGLGSSAAGIISTGVWYSLVIECVIHDTTGRVTAYLNGAQIINLTNVDTRNGSPTTCDRLIFNPALTSIGDVDFDDLFITNSATRPATEYYIESVPVNADGATLNWTPSTGTSHFAVVDELPGSTTDYLSASTVGNIDELEIGTLSSSPASILAAQFVGVFDKTDGVSRAVKLGVKSGATTSTGTDVFLSTAGVRVDRLLDNDPNTSAAWTQSNLEASKIRAEVSV